MSGEKTPKRWLVAGPHRGVPGYVYGRRQPAVVVALRSIDLEGSNIPERFAAVQAVSDNWVELIGCRELWDGRPKPTHWRGLVETIGLCTEALMRTAKIPVFETIQVLRLPASGKEQAEWSIILLPSASVSPAGTLKALHITLQAFDLAYSEGVAEEFSGLFEQGLRDLKRLAPQGSNTPHFLRAAYEQNIPVTALSAKTFQYGQGRRAIWLDSSFTDRTPNISVVLARNKHATATRLAQAGLPVPEHTVVSDMDEAVTVAIKLGYPVVVKPLDSDGGRGVAAGLETADEVRLAYGNAKPHSSHVLVEKHICGRDYRLQVMDGQLLWTVERIPAGVTGDGVQTIAQLITEQNADPRRGEGPHSALKRLVLDEEALFVMSKMGLSPESVLEPGRFAALRRIANVATGGRPVAVNHLVHPDNAKLAVSAAEALRLDLAGIDLIIPDIAESWRKTGAAIIEVNAQPQFGSTTGPHLYGEILKKRLGGDGRIPVILVLGAADGIMLAENIAAVLQSKGSVGWSDERGVAIGADWLLEKQTNLFVAGQMLLTHPRVDAVVLSGNTDEMMRVGLPCDRIDWLVLAGRNVKIDKSPNLTEPAMFDELLTIMMPACAGKLVVVEESGLSVDALRGKTPAHCLPEAMGREELLAAIDQSLSF